jgi:DNA-binding IclR family transcriptional regulator
MSTRFDWMQSGDETILQGLSTEQAEYLPLVSNRLGIHLGYAERRCEVLVRHGLVERAGDGVTYRLTERGQSYLEGERRLRARASDD